MIFIFVNTDFAEHRENKTEKITINCIIPLSNCDVWT